MLIDGEESPSNLETAAHYDFDIFVIGAGSGGTLFSVNFGAKVDEYSRTSVPSIWAIGDVTNRMKLTPVALMEGTCFTKTVFGGQDSKPDYSNIPYAVFRHQEKTIMKLVVDAETDKVLGASICGLDAPEIMQGFAVALKCGTIKAQFDSTIVQ